MSNEQPRLSRMPKVYQPGGGPLRWQGDVTGVLPAAVRAFIDEGLGRAKCTPEQVELVRDYMEYYVNAPCWLTEGMEQEFADLRTHIKSLKTAKEIATWIKDALEVGLDPL